MRERTPRWMALVAIGAVALGSYAIAPAIGGPSRLTTKKAKALFYTKTLSNQRYYSKSASDARYLPKQSGETHVTLDPWDWQIESGAPVRSEEGGYIAFADNDNDNVVGLHDGSVLSQVVSKGLRLQAIEICYELDAGATLDRLEVLRSGPNSGDPVPGTQITFIDDQNDRFIGECHRFNGAAAPVGTAAVLDLRLTLDFPAPGEVRIGRTEAIFVP